MALNQLESIRLQVDLQTDFSFIENKRNFRTMYGKFGYLCGRFAV